MEASSARGRSSRASSGRSRVGRQGRRLLDLDIPGGAALTWLVLAVLAALALAAVVFVADFAVWAGHIHPGVHVSGIDVGGLGPAEASARLTKGLTPRYREPVTVRFEDRSWRIDPATVGAEPATAASVRAALRYGHDGSWLGDAFTRMGAYFAPADIPASTTVDPGPFAAQMDAIARDVRFPTTDAGVLVVGTDVSVTPPEAGRELDRGVADAAVLAALSQAAPRSVRVTASRHEAGVTEASAQTAAEAARRFIAARATVAYGADRWELTREQLARALAFRVVPAGRQTDPGSLVPVSGSDPPTSSAEATGPVALGAMFDPAALGAVLGPRVGGLGRPARDARFVIGQGRVTIAPHQVGLGPDMRALSRDLTVALRSEDPAKRVATLRLGQTLPKLTTEKARSMGITERLSTFTTTYDSGNKPRVNNIHLLAKALDNSLVAPGQSWSINGRVGQRTAEKGYQEANAIVNGKLVPQLGGGICQVATTVFNAIFFSGEPVVERQNHSFYISHYPKGRDATVTWDGPDLRFRNDSKDWILVKTATDADSITVSLYGTNPGYTVTYTTGDLIRTGGYPTETKSDPKLPVGTRYVQDGGLPSYKITVVRTVTKNGAVVRKDTFVSNYRPKVEVVVEGAMPPVKPPSPPAKPATTTPAH